MDKDKIRQIEDLIDLAYDHCSGNHPSKLADTSPKTNPNTKDNKPKKKHTKWQQAFINSEIFKRKI